MQNKSLLTNEGELSFKKTNAEYEVDEKEEAYLEGLEEKESTKERKRRNFIGTTEQHSLTRYETFKKYRDNKKIPKKHKITSRTEFNKVIQEIFKTVAEHLCYNIGGVYLKDLGYFCHWRSANRLVYKVPVKGGHRNFYNSFSDGYWYNTHWFNSEFGSKRIFEGWSMEQEFTIRVQMMRYEQLKKGMKYKNFAEELIALYKNNEI